MTSCLTLHAFKKSLETQISYLEKTDPDKASLIARRIIGMEAAGWTQYALRELHGLGLEIPNCIERPGLKGGGLEELAIDAIKAGITGMIEILLNGNKSEMKENLDGKPTRAQITLPDGRLEQGTHTGPRILSEPSSTCFPKFTLLATDLGTFKSENAEYAGKFHDNKFNDLQEATFIVKGKDGLTTRYKGAFREGRRDGKGTLELRDQTNREYYKYFDGYWRDDAAYDGEYFASNGTIIARLVQGRQQALTQVSTTQQESEPELPGYIPDNTPPRRRPLINHQEEPPSPLPPLLKRDSMQLLPPERNTLLQNKLNNPKSELSLDESITLLTQCVRYGLVQAKKATGKNILIFIGNTGAGKSTLSNYIAGCTMTQQNLEGRKKKVIVVQPRSQGGALDEVMPIGHENISKTFMPQIETTPDKTLTCCDCPGFLDNRGAEINIANAVNIKNAITQASGVRVVILINYHSLLADRGRGLTEMLQIASDLFGTTENLLQHKDSILVGVSQVPIDSSLEEIKEEILSTNMEVMKALGSRLFIYDPLNRPIEGANTRAEILTKIEALSPITNPTKIFRTVLTNDDEAKLLQISDQIAIGIHDAILSQDFKKAASSMRRLGELSVIDHVAIERLLASNRAKINTCLQTLVHQFRDHCHFEEFTAAKQVLKTLNLAYEQFDSHIQNLIDLSKLNQFYTQCESKQQANQRKEQEYQTQLQKAQDRIQEMIAILDSQKRDTQAQLDAQKESFQSMIREIEANMAKTIASYDQMKTQLNREMEQRLAQKEQEINLKVGLSKAETNQQIDKLRANLKKEYDEKIAQNEAEKQKMIREQELARQAREAKLEKEQLELQKKLADLEKQRSEQEKIAETQRRQEAQRKEQELRIAEQKRVEEEKQRLLVAQKREQEKIAETQRRQEAQRKEQEFRPNVISKEDWANAQNVKLPPYPKELQDFLNGDCTIWPGKKRNETHIVVPLFPQVNINGSPVPLTLESLNLLDKSSGGPGYRFFWDKIPTNIPAEKDFHYAVMTNDVIPQSRHESYDDQIRLLPHLYEVPGVLDAARAILWEHRQTGKWYFSNNPWTYTRCKEVVEGYHLAVGGFVPSGLFVCHYDRYGDKSLGVAGWRKF